MEEPGTRVRGAFVIPYPVIRTNPRSKEIPRGAPDVLLFSLVMERRGLATVFYCAVYPPSTGK